ncbi:MAG: peroxiredoxin family protein [Gemmatimonadota bacterium]
MTLRRSLILLAVSLATLSVSVLGFRTGHALTDPPVLGAGETSAAADGSPIRTGPSDWLAIPAPDVEFVTVEGGTARLSDYRGQFVVLNFWGTWCPPCRVEIPELVRAQDLLLELGGTIIAPSVGSGSPEDILRFADEYEINYPIWITNESISVGEFGAPGYPFTVLIGRDGMIRRTYVGPQTKERLVRDASMLANDRLGQPTG